MIPIVFAALLLRHQAMTREFPAFRAYSEPNPDGIEFPSSGTVKGWNDPKNHLVWFVKFKTIGPIQVSVRLNSAKLLQANLRLDIKDAQGINGRGLAELDSAGEQTVDFGTVQVRLAGYVRFELSSDRPLTGVEINFLRLSGAPVSDALINETKWRSGVSVHVRWPTPKDAPITWFYNEILPRTSPLTTYYMACGWSRGYFGIQVNSPTERRVIFSVWDSGTEAVNRNKVDKELQVQLKAKGEDVFTGSFGNEGTGGHSHLVYPWKTGQLQQFLVRAEPSGDKTTYSGYYYFNDKKKWGLISSWIAPKDGGYLRSLYSFIEDFWGGEGQRQRLADFGPAWVRTGDLWSQVLAGTFTHTARVPNYREDYYFKVNGTRVTASAGGYTNDGPVAYGAKFEGVKPSQPPNRDVLEFIKQIETGR